MEGEGGRMPLTLVERFNSRAERYRRGMQRIYKQRIKVFRSGVEPPSSDTQAYDQELANHEKARKKEFAERMTIVNDRFPQLAYMISDVLVYVDVHPMHDRKYLTRVREFAKRSNQQNASTDKPFLLLVQNKADDLSNLLIKETTERFFIAAKEDPELDSFLSCFRDIYFVKIPHRKHNSEEYCSQVEAFRYLVGCLLTNSPPPGGAALTSHNAAAASSVAPVDEHNNSCGAPSTIAPATATTIATPSTATTTTTTTTCGHDSDAGGTVDDVPALAPLPTLAVSPSTALNEAADSLAQDPIDPHFFTEYVWFDVLAEIIKQFPDILSKSEALSKVCRPASDLHEKVFSFFEIMYRPTALLPPSWDRMTEADCRPFLERRRNAFLQARQLSISKLASEIVPGFKQRWGVDSSRHPFFQTVKVVSALRETLEALLSLVEKRQPCLATQGRRCCTQEFMLHADHRCYGHVWKGEPQFDDQPSHEELFCQFFQQVREFTDMSDSEFLQSSLDMLAPLADVEQLRPKCCLLCLSKQNDGLLSCEHAFCRACIDRLVQHHKERESPPKKAALASPSAAAVAAAVAAATLATSRCVLCPLCKKLSPVLDNMDRLPGHAGARVLALDGGGVRGLVLNEIMLCLCSRTNRHPSELFDLIVGTSTGSIIATLWGLIRKPLAECKQLYLSFPSQIFKRRPAHRAIGRTAYTWWNSKPPYKHKDLARELRGFFGASRFIDYADPQYPKVSVVSSVVLDDDDIRTYLFGNYSPSGRVEGIDHPVDYWHGLVEAGCCSSSAPTYFKQMTLGGYKFVDGGLLNNNPTLVAIKEASLIWKDRPLDVVVSLGTGLKRRKIALPKNPSQRHVAQSPPPQPPPLSASSPGGHSWHQHRGDGDVLTSSAEALARPVVWRNAVGQSSLVLASSASSMSMLSSSSASSAASSLLDLHQAPSSLQHQQQQQQQQQRKKQKSSKGENGLVLWVERMIELATGTEQQHYQAMRTLPENVPYFRLNPEGLGNYPLDATSQKTLNEICVKTAEWCQEPEQAAELDRLADVLFAKGFYLSGPNVVEAHVDCDSRFFIQSRLHGALSKDSPMFQVTASLWRSILPLDAADDHHARFNSLRSSSASRSLREGHDDPTNSVGLVMKYVESAPAPMIEVKFVASVPGIYHWEVRVQLESGEELPISGQPWEMTVLPMKKQQPADADLLKELSWTSFVLSCKQFADMEHLDSRDLLVHHRRVKERLGLLGLKEQKVPDSANSLFMAVSDQLYGDFSHASAIRKATATWLEANEFWELENGQHICQYVQDQPFRDYCNALLAGTAWGDHLCLVAVAQMFGARLIVVTSVIGDECLLDIEPILKKTERVIRLCHWGSRSFASVSSGVETHYLPTTWSTQPTAAADDDDDERLSSAAKSKSRRKSKLRRKESTGQKSHRRKSHAAHSDQLPADEQQRSKVD